ncbi:MAG: hypothetical protein ABW007_19540 [Chitinophagaceae bacterium]
MKAKNGFRKGAYAASYVEKGKLEFQSAPTNTHEDDESKTVIGLVAGTVDFEGNRDIETGRPYLNASQPLQTKAHVTAFYALAEHIEAIPFPGLPEELGAEAVRCIEWHKRQEEKAERLAFKRFRQKNAKTRDGFVPRSGNGWNFVNGR